MTDQACQFKIKNHKLSLSIIAEPSLLTRSMIATLSSPRMYGSGKVAKD
jgi:hypothetical protein